MTNEQLYARLTHEARGPRGPGWDSKVTSILLEYCAVNQRAALKCSPYQTATDALVLQVTDWLDAMAKLEAIRKALSATVRDNVNEPAT